MKKILITGGCGFIGSHTSLELLHRGYEIYILDSNINSTFESLNKIKKLTNNKKLHFYKGDVRDKEILKKIFEDAQTNGDGIVGVIHLAGLKSVSESLFNPLNYWDVNVFGSINLFNVMKKFGCRAIVFSSSATIYAPDTISPINEAAAIKPINPYGKTKAVVENILDDFYSSKSEISIACLRYFNPIGAHSSGLLGEEPIGIPTNIFPLINKVAIKEINQIRIFGNNWETRDGTCIRDFIHIMDLAEGHVMALDYVLENKNKNIKLNLGTGKGTSVLELIKTFKRINKVDIPFVFEKRRQGDRAIVFADNSLAKKALNWEPKKKIEDMCVDGWKFKNHK